MLYLDRKYIGLISSQLKLFKQKTADLYVFRCPICGDSEKNKIKTRGYLFSTGQNFMFKCHNCGDTRPFISLLNKVNKELHDSYILENFTNKNVKKDIEYTPKEIVFNYSESLLDRLRSLPSVTPVSDLDDNHMAIQYLVKRDIPKDRWNEMFFIADDHELEQLSERYEDRIPSHDPRLIVPFVGKGNIVFGLVARALKNEKLRYLTLKLNEDDEPLIYGIDRWNEFEYTYVTEGAFDSMFLPNALAVGGSDLKRVCKLVSKHNTVFVFDNEPRNKEIRKQMNRLIQNDFYVCIWPSKINFKDINEMHLNGVLDIKRIIDTNTYRGLEAELQLQDWSKCE
jgi:hypothetical protein